MSDGQSRALTWFLRTWTTIGLLGLAYAAWLVLEGPLGIIMPPLALAAVIVYILNPFVHLLERRGLHRAVGTSIAYLALIGGLVLAGLVLAPIIAEQVAGLAENAPQIGVNVQTAVNDQLARFGVDARVALDPESDQVRETLRQYFLGGAAREQLGEILAGAGSVARTVFHAAVLVVLGPILAFYLLVDLPNVLNGLQRLIPPRYRDEVVGLFRGMGWRVGGYFRGQLLVAAFVGVSTAVGLAAVGLPFWALIGGVTGIFNLIPLIGPFVGGVIGVIVALTAGSGPTQALWVVIVMVAVQQVDNHIISPNVMSRTVELHPVTVMLGLLVAGTLYGILGMLVAIPVIATVKLVALHLLATRAPWATGDLPTPSTASLRDQPESDHDADGAPTAAGTDAGPPGDGEPVVATGSPDRADRTEAPTGG